MLISDIDFTDDDALLCNTNHKPSGEPNNSGGDWFAPNGTRVDHLGAISGFIRNRAPMVVRLKRIMGTQPEGIYKCSINDAASTRHTIFVGLYNSGRGMDFSNTQLYLVLGSVSEVADTLPSTRTHGKYILIGMYVLPILPDESLIIIRGLYIQSQRISPSHLHLPPPSCLELLLPSPAPSPYP